jgi:hypothetical protein
LVNGKFRPESPVKTIDIDVSGKGCIMLEFIGDDVLGTWADAHVVGRFGIFLMFAK